MCLEMSCAVKILVVAVTIEAMKMLEKFELDTTVFGTVDN